MRRGGEGDAGVLRIATIFEEKDRKRLLQVMKIRSEWFRIMLRGTSEMVYWLAYCIAYIADSCHRCTRSNYIT